MIPSNGVYRDRRRRFAEVRSGSIVRGSGKGVSNNRLVSISILSVSSPMPAKGVTCLRHGSSMLASASKRSLPVDVELELGISIVFWIVSSRLHTRAELLVDVELVLRGICEACEVTSMVSTICSCIRSATWTFGISRKRTCGCTVATIGS